MPRLNPQPVAALVRLLKDALRPGRDYLRRAWTHYRFARAPRVVLGAGLTKYPGWLATDQQHLDITNPADFARYWRPNSRRAFLAEHVLEHLTLAQNRAALALIHAYLAPGGYFRIAVPDGLHPDPAYLDHVRPHGPEQAVHGHQILFTYRLLAELLREAGFEVRLLEYWDEFGRFHQHPWSPADGFIERSARFDPRNRNGRLVSTSIIIDAIKPHAAATLPHPVLRRKEAA